MDKKIENRLLEILEENNNDEWQTRAIKGLAYAVLDTRNDISEIRNDLKYIKSIVKTYWAVFVTVIVLLVANIIVR